MNNWENGWKLETYSLHLLLAATFGVFWTDVTSRTFDMGIEKVAQLALSLAEVPQILEFAGFLFVPLPFLFLLKKSY